MENLSKFSGPFMQKSPLYNKADRLRERAKRRSKRLGETQDYDYEDAKVQKLLSKAEKAEKSKPSLENDARVDASYERPDMPPVNYGTPLNQVSPQYGSASAYVSIQPALQNLQKKAVANSEEDTTKGKKSKQVVNTSTGDQVGATKKEQDISKPTRDSELAREKYNTFQDSTRVQSIDGDFYRVDGKGNIHSMKFDKLGKRVFDMDKVSKAMGKFY